MPRMQRLGRMDRNPTFQASYVPNMSLTGDERPCAHLCYCERVKNLSEIARLLEVKNRSMAVADRRSIENAGLRAENERLKAIIDRAQDAVIRKGNLVAASEILMGALEQSGDTK